MEFLFYVIPMLIGGVALFIGYRVLGRSLQLRRAWSSGLVAQGRCVRTYTTTHGYDDNRVSTTLHHVYEFTTADGRSVRFEEPGGSALTVEGDVVPVRYAAERPEHATAQAVRPGLNAATTAATLVFVGVMVVFCLFFVTTFATEFGGGMP
ncbi:DUF3592 domain-containing protein [Streptomyces alkaliterrae]|uniref:DUF3592 domain-containing protein n=1 Tax=Streptomyces alkaliterrae TaxID=2213162 RepID=A0A5P0YXY3_9ACTN|nr:DUF3592 domain-containing protein [Streptomyces alkaliterrae]MBB1256763.1 DUF3592 domain-containing protein [Streptomyces alkaliterrae]MBB1261410.1 DUF3592 domain-containing protein [Streptomyces alkaliterrae]MQS05146.1 DUF3592 domain-containing protein [Streptomyces alkaliterrae]